MMALVTIAFLGTSNAFGHDGRHTSCYLIEGSKTILLDAGYSLLSAIRGQYSNFPVIDAILISHNHPDHYMGIPQLILEDRYVIKRNKMIPIYGPLGFEKKIIDICQIIYSEEVHDHIYQLFEFHEFGVNENFTIPGGNVITLPALHSGNARMQVITIDGKTIGYTGDTSLNMDHFQILLDCDVTITEVSSYEHKIPDHITFKELTSLNVDGSKRVYLSHLGESVIRNQDKIKPPFYLAYDGMRVEI